MRQIDWLELSVDTKTEEIEQLTRRLDELGVDAVQIDDEAVLRDFQEHGGKYWDYIDEALISSMAGVCRVLFYLEDSKAGKQKLCEIQNALADYHVSVRKVRDEDWENNWRDYYKPAEIGDNILVVPCWLAAPENTGRTVLRLDPGLIFGTGTHATTRMCLEELENTSCTRVLDIGSGSGILSVAALLLGG